MKKLFGMRQAASVFAACGIIAAIVSCTGSGVTSGNMKVVLGASLFGDPGLSSPRGQACADCHSPNRAFTDPSAADPTSGGVVTGLFGSRNSPTLSYMAFSPPLRINGRVEYEGGQFWDGRASSLEEQARSPLLTHHEMNNPSKAVLIDHVMNGRNADLMRRVYGSTVFNNTDTAFDAITDAIATFERSPQFSPFTSKFDSYLKGEVTLSPAEKRGLDLFNGKALCSICHPSTSPGLGVPPLFTDFSYDNLGLPKNPANAFYRMPPDVNPDGAAFVDHGLIKTTGRPSDDGKFKTPTLRNVAITGPYFHNGIFSTLEEVMNFYNARDLGGFGTPEVSGTINTGHTGNLSLTPSEISDIIEFMKTLTDGFRKP